MTTTQPTTAAQAILDEARTIRADLSTILRLAEATALPLPGEQTSFLDAVISLQRMTVDGIQQLQQSVSELHRRLDEPGIAAALRRMGDPD